MENKKEADISISVIVPVYNGAKYIRRTLNSIYRQSVKPYEVVIADDGSTDGTCDVIREYVEKHKKTLNRVILIEQNNQGAGAARNFALSYATGKWIAFLDSDDMWDRTKIQQVSDVIKTMPDVDMVAHGMVMADENGRLLNKATRPHEIYDASKDLFCQLYGRSFLGTSCITVKRELVMKAGGFDTSLPSSQDYDLWLKISLLGARLYIIEKPLTKYVIRHDSISSNPVRRYKCAKRVMKRHYPELVRRLGEKRARQFAAVSEGRFTIAHLLAVARTRKIRSIMEILLGIWRKENEY